MNKHSLSTLDPGFFLSCLIVTLLLCHLLLFSAPHLNSSENRELDRGPEKCVEIYLLSLKNFDPKAYNNSLSIPQALRNVFQENLSGMNMGSRKIFLQNLDRFALTSFWGAALTMRNYFGNFAFKIKNKIITEKDKTKAQVLVEVINGKNGETHPLSFGLKSKKNLWKIHNITGAFSGWVFTFLETMRTNREEIPDILEVFLPCRGRTKPIAIKNWTLGIPKRWEIIPQNQNDRVLFKHPAGVNIEYRYHPPEVSVEKIIEAIRSERVSESGQSAIYSQMEIFKPGCPFLFLKETSLDKQEDFFEVILILPGKEGHRQISLFSTQFELISDVMGGAFISGTIQNLKKRSPPEERKR